MFLFLGQSETTPTGHSTGTNFGSIFSPFGNNAVTTCKDTRAANYGKALPCTYISIQTCNDATATNYGKELPCTYTPAPNIKLKKISSMPIAGYIVFSEERLKAIPITTPNTTPTTNNSMVPNGTDTTTGTTTGTAGTQKTTKPTPPPTEFAPVLRYVDRATGNIYETFTDTIQERQFSKTVIPKIYEAFFGNKGISVVMRYLNGDAKTIETFLGNLPAELLGGDTTGGNEIKGASLGNDIEDVSISPDTGSAFYLFNVGNDTAGTTINLTTNKKVQVFDSPFNEWLSYWPNSKTITLTTKPASGVPGYMYALNLSNKNFSKVFGGINGLTTLASPDGKMVLYADDSLALNIYHEDTKVPYLLGVKTLPDKCVWGQASDIIYCAVPKSIDPGEYPDSWYQGEISFSDQIWKIDVKTGNTIMVADPLTIGGGEDIDGIKLALDDGSNYLFFVNKKDSYLWELGLK